jgi:transcriptional regulator with XRE-family HTH domain
MFITNMQTLRERKGLTQTDLAKAAKARGLAFHQQTVQRIETGERPVRLNEAHVISSVLESDVYSMTYGRMPSNRSLLWSMNNLLNSALDYADVALKDIFDEWSEKIVHIFSYDLQALLENHNGNNFEELPGYLQSALAFGILALNAAKKAADTAGIFGDFSGNSNAYKVDDYSQFSYLASAIKKYDCPELRLLAAESAPKLCRLAEGSANPPSNPRPMRLPTDEEILSNAAMWQRVAAVERRLPQDSPILPETSVHKILGWASDEALPPEFEGDFFAPTHRRLVNTSMRLAKAARKIASPAEEDNMRTTLSVFREEDRQLEAAADTFVRTVLNYMSEDLDLEV